MNNLKKRLRNNIKSSGTGTSSLSEKAPPLEYKHVMISSLSQDLLAEILSRLPTKPLITFKCVCKTWNHLISTIVYPQRRVAGFFYQCQNDYLYGHHRCVEQFNYIPTSNANRGDDVNITDVHLSFLPCHPKTRIVDCRNGLLLCSLKNSYGHDYYICNPVRRDYYICNPVTKHWVALPKLVIGSNAVVALVFISIGSPHYKVIRFSTFSRSFRKTHLDLDIYSSKTGQWVQSKVSVNPSIVGTLQRRSVFLNGALYLLSTVHQVLRFDVREESCQMIELPTELWIPVVFPCAECLGESDGHLNYAYYDGSIMKIWSLDHTNTKEWIIKHTISIHPVDDPSPMPINFINILALHPHLDEVFLRVGDKILSYNFTSRMLKDVCILTCENVNCFWFWVHPFSECLLSLEGKYRRLH